MRGHRGGHNSSMDETLVALAMAKIGGNSFVFRPGGVAGGTVFTDFHALYNALVLLKGAATNIVIDDTIATPVIPAGAYNLSQSTLQGVPNSTTNSGGAVLHIADGATITAPSNLALTFLEITYLGTATPCIHVPAGQEANITVNNCTIVASNAGAPFTKSTGGIVFAPCYAALLGDGTHPVFADDGSGGATYVFAIITDLLANSMIGGAACHYTYDSTSTPNLPQGGATLFAASRADGVAYAAAVPGNWVGTPPATVADALDRIAAHVGPVP